MPPPNPDLAGDDESERQGPRAVFRALSILTVLGAHGPSASISDLVGAIGFPLSTTHRLLQALVEAGYAVQDPVTKRYTLGPNALRLGEQAADRGGLRTVARPILERLRAQTRETVFLSRKDGLEIEYLEVLTSDRSLRMVGEPGERGPVYATSQGKSILAFVPEDERNAIIDQLELVPLTRYTITDKQALCAELAQIRAQGYAVNDQQREIGTRSVAAPILDVTGYPIAATCVGAPTSRSRGPHLRKVLAPLVIVAAADVSARLAESDSHLAHNGRTRVVARRLPEE